MTIQLPIIGTALAALIAAAVVALISTPVVRSLAFRIGAVDIPKDERRMHKEPIPRLGGLAIFIGCVTALLHMEKVGKTADIFTVSQSRQQNTLFNGVYHICFCLLKRLGNNCDAVFSRRR